MTRDSSLKFAFLVSFVDLKTVEELQKFPFAISFDRNDSNPSKNRERGARKCVSRADVSVSILEPLISLGKVLDATSH